MRVIMLPLEEALQVSEVQLEFCLRWEGSSQLAVLMKALSLRANRLFWWLHADVTNEQVRLFKKQVTDVAQNILLKLKQAEWTVRASKERDSVFLDLHELAVLMESLEWFSTLPIPLCRPVNECHRFKQEQQVAREMLRSLAEETRKCDFKVRSEW